MNRTNLALTAVAVLLGIAIGVGGYTFVYAKGYSYLSNDPAACTNCHSMRSYYDGWVKGSHHGAAACNDCHTPNNPIAKYATKASNGFFHSLAFTSGLYSDNIEIRARNHRVTEAACRRCHQELVVGIESEDRSGDAVSCIRCHQGVGHDDTVASEALPLLRTGPQLSIARTQP